MNGKYPPRDGDLPREELMKLAAKETGPHGTWPGADVFFKVTCPYCGERCTMDKNELFENVECFACGKTSPVEYGGFSVMFTLGGKE
jgi:ribosomal protein S27E